MPRGVVNVTDAIPGVSSEFKLEWIETSEAFSAKSIWVANFVNSIGFVFEKTIFEIAEWGEPIREGWLPFFH